MNFVKDMRVLFEDKRLKVGGGQAVNAGANIGNLARKRKFYLGIVRSVTDYSGWAVYRGGAAIRSLVRSDVRLVVGSVIVNLITAQSANGTRI
jgi:hypothetical protein